MKKKAAAREEWPHGRIVVDGAVPDVAQSTTTQHTHSRRGSAAMQLQLHDYAARREVSHANE